MYLPPTTTLLPPNYSLTPEWTLRFQRRTLWEQVCSFPKHAPGSPPPTPGCCSRQHCPLCGREGVAAPWQLGGVLLSDQGFSPLGAVLQVCVPNPDQQQQPQWSRPGPRALMCCRLLWDQWSSPIWSLLPAGPRWPAGQSSHPQLGSLDHNLQHRFRSGIL